MNRGCFEAGGNIRSVSLYKNPIVRPGTSSERDSPFFTGPPREKPTELTARRIFESGHAEDIKARIHVHNIPGDARSHIRAQICGGIPDIFY
jgi:hypothetical protein